MGYNEGEHGGDRLAKYRRQKVKRQHHVLTELEDGLKALSRVPFVDGVIPGIIRPKSGGSMGFTFQYLTHSGFKLIGRSSGAAQEIFVITQNAPHALSALKAAGIIRDFPSNLFGPLPDQS